MKLLINVTSALLFAPTLLFAQATPTVKQAPPPGIAVPEADAAELKAGLATLGKEIEAYRVKSGINKPNPLMIIPDAEIFHKAVRYALDYGEFFNPKEIAAAKELLKLGSERIRSMGNEPPAWATKTGAMVRGYRSKIDDSVQPYGLIVPEDWKPGDKRPRPLYLWFHGRGDTLSEVNFINSRLRAKRDFAPADAFELHLYGRWCNASKFAGEVDAFEAMADVQRRYAIDPNRIACLGFSMGGATAWHLGAHYPGTWAVASAGAGFAETAIYAKVDDAKKTPPTPLERKLFALYDSTTVAANFGNLPFIAYSGEIDPQKQSADIMEEALSKEGLKLERLIGPGVGHKYEPETKKELSKRIDAAMTKGRETLSPHVRFQTCTLRYNQCKWITLDALEQHWEKAEIDATLVDEGTFRIKTKNVAAFTIQLPAGPAPLDKTHPPRVVIDEQELVGLPVRERWTMPFKKENGKWRIGWEIPITGQVGDFPPLKPSQGLVAGPKAQLAKRHGLQGPIDDAFMDSFIFVRPTGKPLNEKVGAWVESEFQRAVTEWRKVFRGDVRVKTADSITADDMAKANIVLWGDPSSNRLIASDCQWLAQAAPTGTAPVLRWSAAGLELGGANYSSADHVPILIYPNPHNPQRYVVLNSGFTFRMGAKTSNALQTPKLPDWAVIDLKTPPDDHWPGEVVDAGFFDESWQFPKK